MSEGEKERGFNAARPPPRPEFNACFSASPAGVAGDPTSSTRAKMRWGLWSPDDAAWMQLVQDNYEKHHRLATAPAVSGRGDDGLVMKITRRCDLGRRQAAKVNLLLQVSDRNPNSFSPSQGYDTTVRPSTAAGHATYRTTPVVLCLDHCNV